MAAAQVVGILSPGEMGAAVGRMLLAGGLRVVTCLQGRSHATRLRAQQAGIAGLPSYEALVQEADLLLSILPPDRALITAQRVAKALKETGAGLVYADCNATSPQTTREVARTITQAGGRFLDAGIIGGPPVRGRSPHIYVSGPDPGPMQALAACGLDIRILGQEIGRASALKMVYSASTKGTAALWLALLVAAEAQGLADVLGAEVRDSQPEAYRRMQRYLPTVPRRAHRWIGEMEEVAAAFQSLGLTPLLLQGAAEMYRLVARSPLAPDPASGEVREPPLEEILRTLDRMLASPDPPRRQDRGRA